MSLLGIAYPFGCQTDITGLFRKQYADGILGLSDHPSTSIVTALYKEGIIARNAFSLCLTREKGYITLGGIPLPSSSSITIATTINNNMMDRSMTAAEKKIQLTPITGNHGYYSIEIIRIDIGGTTIASAAASNDAVDTNDGVFSKLGNDRNRSKSNRSHKDGIRSHLLDHINSGKGCLIDSGTTDTFLPTALKKIVQKTVKQNLIAVTTQEEQALDYFSNENRRHMFTYDEFISLPTIKMVAKNEVIMDIKPENYMENVPHSVEASSDVVPWNGRVLLINRIYFEEGSPTTDDSGGSSCVLGANSMFGYNMLFDLQSRQIGVTPCMM